MLMTLVTKVVNVRLFFTVRHYPGLEPAWPVEPHMVQQELPDPFRAPRRKLELRLLAGSDGERCTWQSQEHDQPSPASAQPQPVIIADTKSVGPREPVEVAGWLK